MFCDFCHTCLGQCTRLPLRICPLLCIVKPVLLFRHQHSTIQCSESFGSESSSGNSGRSGPEVAKPILSICNNDIFTQYIPPIIIRLTHANVWESMGKPCSCMQFIKSHIFYCKSRENPYQYYKSRENLYQVLQVMRGTSERAMKSKVRMIKSLSP